MQESASREVCKRGKAQGVAQQGIAEQGIAEQGISECSGGRSSETSQDWSETSHSWSETSQDWTKTRQQHEVRQVNSGPRHVKTSLQDRSTRHSSTCHLSLASLSLSSFRQDMSSATEEMSSSLRIHLSDTRPLCPQSATREHKREQ